MLCSRVMPTFAYLECHCSLVRRKIVHGVIDTIRIEKHLQYEKLLGLAGGNTKKHGNKKSGESITPIRYNVIHMYIFARRFSLIISLVVFPLFGGFPRLWPILGICHIGGRVYNVQFSIYMHFRGQ